MENQMRRLLILAMAFLFPTLASAQLIPTDRLYPWNPGLTAVGGIPNRAAVCATVSLGNGVNDDSARIQTAINSCPPNGVVQLLAGTYVVNNPIALSNQNITLRGAGAGSTILRKTNGAPGRDLTKPVPGTNPTIYFPLNFNWPADTSPAVVLGASRYAGPDNSTSVNLTSDGTQGSQSVTVTSAAGFQVGQFVLIDEDTGSYDLA